MKTMFVWENVDSLTQKYYGGGAVVIADTLDAARELLVKDSIQATSTVFTDAPDFTAPVVSDEDKVFIFQDTGY